MESPKSLIIPEPSFEREPFDGLKVISTHCADPVKLFSVTQMDLIAVNNNFICVASGRSLTIYRALNDEPKSYIFTSTIKIIEISKFSDIVSMQLENLEFLVFDLEAEKEIFDFSLNQNIQIMKWNNWAQAKLGIYWNDGGLEIWSNFHASFSSVKFEIKDINSFDFISAYKLVYQAGDFKPRVMNLSENTTLVIDSSKEEKVDRIVALDEDKVCLIYADTVSIYSFETDTVILQLFNKQVFEYDPCSDYLWMRNSGSLQISICSKENCLAQTNQDMSVYFTLMEACNELFIRKKNDKPEAVARHGDDVFFYGFKGEYIEEALPEIKEENLLRQKKKFRNKFQDSKFEQKAVNPKEIISPIVMSLNKNFEEIIKKVEKSVSPHTVNSLVTKTIQSAFESKIDPTIQKNLVQSTVSQALRYEFQTSLIPLIQQQLNENFGKLTNMFQDSLKNSSDYNNKAAAKAVSLDAHMKNSIENISNATNRIEKEYLSQIKKISETEAKLFESFESRKIEENIVVKSGNSRSEALKKEIDAKLKIYDFEGAISRILKENNAGYLFSVLDVINPKIFTSSRVVNEMLIKQLFYQLIECIEKELEFREIYVWIEELGKIIIIPQNEVSKLLVRFFELSEKKPKIRDVIKIFTSRLT